MKRIDDYLDDVGEAYVYGSVAKGTAKPNSDVDVYVAGQNATEVEDALFLERPVVDIDGTPRRLHLIGPSMVDRDAFLKIQPEAKRIR